LKMNKIPALVVGLCLTGAAACGLIDKLIPDVDTTYAKTFSVRISDNRGKTGTELIDVKKSSDYNDFKKHIDGFDINKITWEISNYQAPDDLYFSGDINIWNMDSTEIVKVGEISRTRLSEIPPKGEEGNVEELLPGLRKVTAWLKSPGSFYMNASYYLTDATGAPYTISPTGYSFDLKITYYVTVITGSK